MFLFCLFRRFQFYRKEVTWVEAVSECRKLGGNLAEVRSQKQFDAIKKIHDHQRTFVWLGGCDEHRNQIWTWLSDGKRITGNNPFWRPNEPNNSGGKEFCLEFRGKGLNDIPCFGKDSFVCEFGARGSNVELCDN